MSNKTFWRNLSHFGRFTVSGADAAQLLHHLTTNNIKKLKAGEGCDAILINNKARVLDWLSVWREESGYRVLTSPNRRAMFAPHANKFVLYRQDVKIEDVTEQGAIYGLFGGAQSEVLARWNANEINEAPLNSVLKVEVEGVALTLSRTRRLPGGGVLVESSDAAALGNIITKSGVSLSDDETYNTWRVEHGVPAAGLELTEDVNPWEANLDFAISLDKGCYNGQEVVARLHTYKKIKQNLMGLRLASPIPMSVVAGNKVPLKYGGKDAGFLTSSAQSAEFGAIALAYIRGDHQEAGRELEVLTDEPQKATVVELPFLTS